MINQHPPPKHLLQFFRWFCHPDFVEDIEGDLHEKYDRHLRKHTKRKAWWLFLIDVLSLFRIGLMRPITIHQNLIHPGMFRHNLKISWRLLLRNKDYSLINIGGLGLGLVMAMFIILWIKDELSFNGFHKDKNRIYQVMSHLHSGDHIETFSVVNWNIAEALREEYPSVEEASVVTFPREILMTQEGHSFKVKGLYAEPAFFDVFSWNLMAGNSSTLLDQPNSVVISSSVAEKYFDVQSGDFQQLIGQTIQHNIENLEDLKVSGIFEDIPKQSSLQFDFILPADLFLSQNEWAKDWNNNEIQVFLKMKEGKSGMELSQQITNLQNQHITKFRCDVFLHPLQDWYLNATFKDGKSTGGKMAYIRIFAIIALMIVLIACINFMNLSTARSIQRAKEIGVRKAIGAEKRLLVGQFMGESFLLVLFAFCLALILIPICLPYFNALTDKTISLADWDSNTVLVFVGIGILTALAAGTYPAFYLSGFNPIKVLKGTFHQSANTAQFRKALVIFQFVMSTLLIVGTLSVYQQMQFIQNKNLGYDRENVLYMPLEANMFQQYEVLHQELLKAPEIIAVSSANTVTMQIMATSYSVGWRGKAPDNPQAMEILPINFDFLDVMKMEVIQGRDFDRSFARDSFNFLINEKAAEVMGFEDPIGEEITYGRSTGAIIGVVKDFNSASLYAQINPILMVVRPEWNENIFLRTQAGKTAEAIATMKTVAGKINPDYPFEYHFLNASYEDMYKSEQAISQLSFLFAVFALFIAGIGLLGLAIFAVQRRLKEISIRKVLGASIGNLAILLSKDFVFLLLIAFGIAVPIAFFLMEEWLGNFVYRTELSLGIFLIAGGITLLITLLTIGFYAIKITFINPIQSLQAE